MADSKEELDSRISIWSDEDEMDQLERTTRRDFLVRMRLDLQGGPIFTVKVILVLIFQFLFYIDLF